MKVVDYELFEVPPHWLFLKLTTSDGNVGWGEPVLEGRTESVRCAVKELLQTHILGESPEPIQDHWHAMYQAGHYRGGPILMTAISGIDQALWDIKGKQLGVPVYKLLGGRARDVIRTYHWVGGTEPEAVAKNGKRLVDEGFTTLKLDASQRFYHLDSKESVNLIASRLGHLRDAVGTDIDIAVDFRGRISQSFATTVISALERHNPLFVEEPVKPESNHALADIAGSTTTPLATGERLYSRWDFRPLLLENAVDVVQPSVAHAGGITEVIKIANLADTFEAAIAPTSPNGPISFAASLQVDAYASNFLIQNHYSPLGVTPGDEDDTYVANPDVLLPTDGRIDVPEEPGLGVEMNESFLEKQAEKDVDWDVPTWRHEDGSVAEW